MLKAGLLKLNFIQSKADPCLFYKNNIVCAIYVDDTIFWSPDESIIDTTISELKSLNFDLTDEGDVDSFLGVKIDTDEDGAIIKSLGLDKQSTKHQTPAVSPPLHKDEDKEIFNAIWNYTSLKLN